MRNLCTTASLVALAFASGQAHGATIQLIELDKASGNGDFFVDDVNEVSVFGGGSDTPTIQTNRDRAFRNTGTVGRGIAITGWGFTRAGYGGGNAAYGTDGLFGFAPTAGTGVGESGQAFLNNGSVNAVSDDHALGALGYEAGTTIDLSYLLGGDQAATAQATVSLVFDRGLGTEFTHTFAQASRSGVNTTTGLVTESYVTTAVYTTVSVELLMGTDGDNSGVDRALVDKVRLSADGTPVPEPGSMALLGLGGLLVARRRRA